MSFAKTLHSAYGYNNVQIGIFAICVRYYECTKEFGE